MKTVKIILAVFGFLFLVALYAVFAPTHGHSLGVSITPHGFQTKVAGQGIPLYAISNSSSQSVLVWPGIERRGAPHQVIDVCYTQRLLGARSEILVGITNAPAE